MIQHYIKIKTRHYWLHCINHHTHRIMATKTMKRQDTSATSLMLDQINNHLQCAVCLDHYSNPKLLPCHHFFCLSCIKQLPVVKNQNTNHIVCPICREQHLLSLRKLPNAFHLSSLLELEEQITEIKKSHEKCLIHKDQYRGYCNKCNEPVCYECVTEGQHKNCRRLTNVSEAYEQFKEMFEKEGCNIEEGIAKFNDTIKRIQKQQTVMTERADSCKEAVIEQTRLLITKLQENESQMIEEINDIKSNALQKLVAQEEAAELAKARLVNSHELVSEALNKWSKTKLLSKQVFLSNQIAIVTSEVDPIEFEPFESCEISFRPAAINASKPIDIGRIQHTSCDTQSVSINPATVKQDSFATLKLKSNNRQPFPLPSVSSIRGRVMDKENSTAVINCSVTQVHPGEFKLEYMIPKRGLYTLGVSVGGVDVVGSPFNIHVISRLESIGRQPIKSFQKLTSPCAIGVFEDGHIAVGNSSDNTVNLFDQNGRLLSKISFSDNLLPQSIAISHDENILLAAGNRIFKLQPSTGDCLAVFGFKEPGKAFSHLNNPTGIAVHPINGHVFIMDSNNNRIQELDSDLMRPHTFFSDSKKRYITNPFDIAINNQGNVYVSDRKSKTIVKFAPDGTFASRIGSKGHKPSQFIDPTSIAILDKQLYIADPGNKRISIFDLTNEECLHAFPFTTSGMIHIAVSNHGYVHVCNSDTGEVSIY